MQERVPPRLIEAGFVSVLTNTQNHVNYFLFYRRRITKLRDELKHLKVHERNYISKQISADLRQSDSEYLALRTVIDFVSGLTDRHALSLYRKIKGISLN